MGRTDAKGGMFYGTWLPPRHVRPIERDLRSGGGGFSSNRNRRRRVMRKASIGYSVVGVGAVEQLWSVRLRSSVLFMQELITFRVSNKEEGRAAGRGEGERGRARPR